MKVIPRYKVIGPNNYDRIIHNIDKQDIGYRPDKWKDEFSSKIKKFV